MGITKNYLLGALSAALLAGLGCHSSQKSATAALPAQANVPTLTATASPKPQPATKQQGATKAQPATRPKPTVVEKKVSVPPKEQPVQPAPKPDPVGELITQVEREYQAGQDNYKAGHLDAAKQSFDRAFNLITGSAADIRSDERVQRELDRVLDGVN